VKCPACGGIQLQTEFQTQGLVHVCKACDTKFSAAAVQASNEVALPEPPPLPVRLPPKFDAPAPPPRAKSLDVVKEARAQLKVMNAEIARLQKLIEKRDELKRLLDAASNKPKRPAKAVSSKA